MSYVRTLTICLLLVYFVSAAGCHCFDLAEKLKDFSCEMEMDLLSEFKQDHLGHIRGKFASLLQQQKLPHKEKFFSIAQ